MLTENIESSKTNDFRSPSPISYQGRPSKIIELLNRPMSPPRQLPSMNSIPKSKENNSNLSNIKITQQSCSPKRRITPPDVDKPLKHSIVVVQSSSPKVQSSPKVVITQRQPTNNVNLNDVKAPNAQTSLLQSSYKSQTIPLQNPMEPSGVLNLSHMMSLGEPDPSSINKHDILSALAFDARG